MKILITGGAGFIGSNFVEYALNHEHQIINVDKLTYAGNLNNLTSAQKNSNYTFYKEDICNRNALEQIVFKHEPDVVLHMAAESHVDRSIVSPEIFIQTNIVGTHTLLDVCLKYYSQLNNKKNFKFLHLSTDEVFGALGPSGKFDETMPYQPNSPYAASKASSDLLVRAYQKTYAFPAMIVNSSNNYGPRQHAEKLIPQSIMNALNLKPLPIYGNGKQIRDWLFVEDHVRALLAILEHGKLGESYCIGADNEITNLELVHIICDHLTHIRPQNKSYSDLISFVTDRPGHDFRYATNASKLKAHTGWKPRENFQTGLSKTIEWYLTNTPSSSAQVLQ